MVLRKFDDGLAIGFLALRCVLHVLCRGMMGLESE